jgi:hypothetical protein
MEINCAEIIRQIHAKGQRSLCIHAFMEKTHLPKLQAVKCLRRSRRHSVGDGECAVHVKDVRVFAYFEPALFAIV